ncbi:MAG TPA: type II glyceraldehyde-3-phosphate dehydrogenase [Nitrososphaerales archaeon]|nr:type II glyceraldehyde-3-phosphate dehydrogenase [Nitrososphaerales archaeon]
MIRVSVNGYSVIGRRIADAVSAQPDMKLVGISKVKPDYKARRAFEKGYPVYALDQKGAARFIEAGIKVSGIVREMVSQSDVVVDASPEDVGLENKKMYEEFGKKAIFQGGEEDSTAGFSFVAQCNFERARGRRYLRVVSCNSTALCRCLNSLDQGFGVSKARVVIARRAADPDEISKGPIDAVVLDPVNIPSHHGPDVNTVLPNFPVITMAMKVPTTHMHVHAPIVSLKDSSVTTERVIEKFEQTPRLLLVNSKDGFKSTAQLIDYARDLGRPRNDIYEVVIFRDSIKVIDSEVYFFMAVHQEAIVTPENIDAIRALCGAESKEESMLITNKTLGI